MHVPCSVMLDGILVDSMVQNGVAWQASCWKSTPLMVCVMVHSSKCWYAFPEHREPCAGYESYVCATKRPSVLIRNEALQRIQRESNELFIAI